MFLRPPLFAPQHMASPPPVQRVGKVSTKKCHLALARVTDPRYWPPPRRACSSVVEHCVDIAGVASSILATPTIENPGRSPTCRGFYCSAPQSSSGSFEPAPHYPSPYIKLTNRAHQRHPAQSHGGIWHRSARSRASRHTQGTERSSAWPHQADPCERVSPTGNTLQKRKYAIANLLH